MYAVALKKCNAIKERRREICVKGDHDFLVVYIGNAKN